MEALANIKRTLVIGFLSLPLMIFVFTGFVGISLGNLSMLLFVFGQIAVGLVVGLFHVMTGKTEFAFTKYSDLGNLIPSATDPLQRDINVFPSYWVALVSFFFTYVASNAISVAKMPKEGKQIGEALYKNRTTKSTTIAVISILIGTIFMIMRWLQDLETVPGMAMGIALGLGMGIGWYYLSKACGARNADILGIVYQMLPDSAKDEKPLACIYTPSP
jgi:hypothetical protein